jgi:DNA polymerase-2
MLHKLGVATYEADVRFAMRYLIDRDIKGGVEILGTATTETNEMGVDVIFDDPQLRPAQVQLAPRVLSFDIETDPDTDRLLAIACYSQGDVDHTIDEVVVVDEQGRPMPVGAIGVPDEAGALLHFAKTVQRLDPDVITGWNVIDFDLTMLARVAERVKYDLQLGRANGRMRIRAAEGYFGSGSANIPGRLVLDGLDLVRGAFIKMDDYTLDTVALAVLGEGKTLGGNDRDKVAEILHTYRHDLSSFAEYARTDARLALQILEKLDVLDLAFARSSLTGMTPDRVAASIASFDFLYLSALHKRKLAAPSVNAAGRNSVQQGGGAVYEPVVGIHSNVWVCDFKSLYPSIIRTFNIDPLGYCQAELGAPSVATYDGTRFASKQGEASILPAMLDDLFPQRAQAKARGDDVASQAIKILMNSFYGVLGTPACRFYNPKIANAITSQGRYLLGWSKSWFEARGFEVLYGDTDSVFVASGMADPQAALEAGRELVPAFNEALDAHLRDTANVVSKLELEFEKLYTKLFLASVRGGSTGARKRYAGQRLGAHSIEFIGMEVVRRDWTELAKEVQRQLFVRLFEGDEVADYLKQTVDRVRDGELDHLLVYRKGLRKSVESYTKNIPQHVQAVRKSTAKAPRIVEYIVTEAGPELITELTHAPDRAHYVERQIKPVAEPVLEALGLSFDRVIGDDRQISLF